MKVLPRRRARRGAAIVESLFVLMGFLLLILGLVDVGLGVLRNHMLSQAARQGIRQVVVHGEYAPAEWNGGKWGPSTYTGTAAAEDPIASSIRPFLTGIDPATVNITVQWLDGTNRVGERVQLTVRHAWTPMVLSFLGSKNLSAASTMRIAH